jgi:hypothetical protein
MQIRKECLCCGVSYNVSKYRAEISKYCSRKCLAKDRVSILHSINVPKMKGNKPHNFKNISIDCKKCGITFSISPSRVGKKFYCSQKCYSEAQRNLNVAKYNRVTQEGRRVSEHILIAEKLIKRSLSPNEHIHHINGICSDNRIENLAIIDAKVHNSLHSKHRKHPIPLDGIEVIFLSSLA